MSIKILCDSDNMACLYDSVYDKAFGPIIYGDKRLSAQEIAEDFLAWAKYSGVETSIDAETIYTLWQEYEQAKLKDEWPLPEME